MPGHMKHYIIKYYKHIISNEIHDFEKYHFLAWNSFDGIRIISVDDFEDFQKRSLGSEDEDGCGFDRITSCERQKVYIYSLENVLNENSDSQQLFTNLPDKDDSYFLYANENLDNPVIVISTIGFSEYVRDTVAGKIVHEKLKRVIEDNDLSVSYRIYGTLIPHSIVVVYRAKKYEEISKCIEGIKFLNHDNLSLEFSTCDGNSKLYSPSVTNVYSVFGLEKNGVDNWNDNNPVVRIQLIVSSDFLADSFENLVKSTGCMDFERKPIQRRFGGFDYEVRGRIKNNKRFIDLITKDLPMKGNIFHCSSTFHFNNNLDLDEAVINPKTDAVIATEGTVNDADKERRFEKSISDLKYKYDKLQSCKDCVSPVLEDLLSRLIVRVSQSIYSLNTREIIELYLPNIVTFLDRVFEVLNLEEKPLHIKGLEDNDANAIIKGIKYINTLLDNNIVDYYSGFESPQREPSFLGSASVVLAAYQKYINKALKWLNIDHLSVCVFADSGNEINITGILNVDNMQTKEQYFIRIPNEMIFSVREVICFITHELIHKFVDKADKNIKVKRAKINIEELKEPSAEYDSVMLSKLNDDEYVADGDIGSNRAGCNHDYNTLQSQHRGSSGCILYKMSATDMSDDHSEYIYTESKVDILSLAFLSGILFGVPVDSSRTLQVYLKCSIMSFMYRQADLNSLDVVRYFIVTDYILKNFPMYSGLKKRFYDVSKQRTDDDVSYLKSFMYEFLYILEAYGYKIKYDRAKNNILKYDDPWNDSFGSYYKDIIALYDTGTSAEDKSEYTSFLNAYNIGESDAFDSDLNIIRVLYYGIETNSAYENRQDDIGDCLFNIENFFKDVAIRFLTDPCCTSALVEINSEFSRCNYNSFVVDKWNSQSFKELIEKHTGDCSILFSKGGNEISKAAQLAFEQYKLYKESMCENSIISDDEGIILEYLDAYSKLLIAIYMCNVREKANPAARLLSEVFHFGCSYVENGRSYAQKFSPFVVSGLYLFAKNLENYKSCAEFVGLDDVQKNIFARILANNALFRLRRYNIFAVKGGYEIELVKPGNSENICDIISPDESSSILDVRPIRLLEKIMMGYDQWEKSDEGDEEFKIGVVGNIKGDSEGIELRIKELAESLLKCLKVSPEKSISIVWHCTPDSAQRKYNYKSPFKLRIKLEDYSKTKLLDTVDDGGIALTNFIMKNHLLFFIDCPQLYRDHEFSKQTTANYYRDYISDINTCYSKDFERFDLGNNLYNTGLISSLLTNISGQSFDNDAEYGKLMHRVNMLIVNHIDRCVTYFARYKSAYILLSSDTAISDSDYNKYNVVREERYNSKSFDVINFVSNPSSNLCALPRATDTERHTVIVTLYQIIKNINRDLIEDNVILDKLYAANELSCSSETIRRMRGIYVVLDYHTVNRKIVTSISTVIDDKAFGEQYVFTNEHMAKISGLVKSITLPVFQASNAEQNEYLSLIKKYKASFYTALYSAARNVGDILYLHLLRDKYGVVVLEDINFSDIVILDEYRLKTCSDSSAFELQPKHSIDKRNYNEIMRICDRLKNSYDTQQYAIYVAKKTGGCTSPVIIFENILDSCKKLEYQDSYLYENLVRAIGSCNTEELK